MVVRLVRELQRENRPAGGDELKLGQRAALGTETINPPPWRQSSSRHKTLPLHVAVSKDQIWAGREKVGLAFKARYEVPSGEADKLYRIAIDLALGRAGGQEVSQVEDLLARRDALQGE